MADQENGMLADLLSQADKAIAEMRQPAEDTREKLEEALKENELAYEKTKKELEARLEQVNFVLSGTRLRKRAGRPRGSRNKKQPEEAVAA